MTQSGKTNLFDTAASTWDAPDKLKLAQVIIDAITLSICLTPTMNVQDFGCGTGAISLQVAPEVDQAEAGDTSLGMLTELRKKA